jgi:hypothetical protein
LSEYTEEAFLSYLFGASTGPITMLRSLSVVHELLGSSIQKGTVTQSVLIKASRSEFFIRVLTTCILWVYIVVRTA